MWSRPEAFPKYDLSWFFQYGVEHAQPIDDVCGGVRVSEVYPVRAQGNGSKAQPMWGTVEDLPMGMAYQLGDCYIYVGDELMVGRVSTTSDPESPTRWSVEVSADEIITAKTVDSGRMAGVVAGYNQQGRLMDLQIDATFPHLGWKVDVYGNDDGNGQVEIEGGVENVLSEVEVYGEEGPVEEAFDEEDFKVKANGWTARLTGESGMMVLLCPKDSWLVVKMYHQHQLQGKLLVPLALPQVEGLWKNVQQLWRYPGESMGLVPGVVAAVQPQFHKSWQAVDPQDLDDWL